MAPVDLPYLHLFRAKGKAYAYYRRHLPDGSLFREAVRGPAKARCEPGSPAFLAAYQALAARFDQLAATRAPEGRWPSGSFGALWHGFKASAEFQQLAAKTQRDYARLIEPLLDDYGVGAVRTLTRTWVIQCRDELAATPRTANLLVAVLRRLLTYAQDVHKLRDDNPALRIKALRTGPGYRRWTEAEIAAMTGPTAPPAVRTAVMLGLFTGQRESDLLHLVWSAYDGRSIRLRQRKARHLPEGIEITIPVHAELRAELDASARTTAVVLTPDGKRAWNDTTFRHVFAETRQALDLPADLHFHGLRHSAASRLAEAGCSDAEIQAITGHRTRAMVAHYTAGARQERLARAAITRLEKVRRTPRKRASGKPD